MIYLIASAFFYFFSLAFFIIVIVNINGFLSIFNKYKLALIFFE